MRKWGVVVLLLWAAAGWAQPEGDFIELGVKLHLGTTQAEVLKAMAGHYEVRPLEDPSQFVVYTKPAEGEKPRWEGMLVFREGKLVSAERLWAYENDDNSVAMAKSLVGVLSAMLRDGRNTCTVEALKSDAPDAQGETVFLNCGRRILKISVAKVEGYKEDASVSEVLEK